MKKIKLFIAALVLASAVVAISINSRTSNDPFFEANLEALTEIEKYPAMICYINGLDGPWESAFFCNQDTNTTALYTCPDGDSYGKKTTTSYCIK